MQIVQTHDIRISGRARKRAQSHFERVRRAETSYAIQLRKIARHVGDLVKRIFTGNLDQIPEINRTLEQYAQVIQPWASATATRMLAEVSRRDETAWHRASQEIGVNLAKEIREAPIGAVMRKIHTDQVNLITSLPIEAAQRVQQVAQDYVAGGKRYEDMVQMIVESGHVALSRATLIARTETAGAQSALVEARGKYIGSEGYTWRAVGDYRTRPMHKKLNNTFHKWDDPPIAEENGDRHHPGRFPNCRCWMEPQIPDNL
jgi:SPP1 gp7 family putative phage head morphogenesis protein